MKTEDIERLKDICEREGFTFRNNIGSVFHIDKKDPWEGVEFVTTAFKGWRFYKKVSKITSNDVYFLDGSHFGKDYLLPITEQEYVEQLKKDAFERFGEIKEGDRFESAETKTIVEICSKPEFEYHKELDCLCCGGVVIYQSGKWATKLQESVEVSFNNCIVRVDATGGEYYHEVDFSFFLSNRNVSFESSKIGQFLSEQLEKYLNEGY